MFDFRGKKVLVAGGTGLIGTPLVEALFAEGAAVRVASLDDPSRADPKAEFVRLDLTSQENCMTACAGMDYVFNLLCVKGSPLIMKQRPASVFTPHILFNTHLMDAARKSGVKGFMYTSTYGVYAPAEVLTEDDVWKTFPSEHDKFAGWAKRMGELQAEAYRIEYGWDAISIVRPANVYGPHDNFGGEGAMVVPSLIKRAVDGENPFVVWGDGSSVRDFIHARDVARGMIHVAKFGIAEPVNLGSGVGVSIKELVEAVLANTSPRPELVWDTSKPSGDKKRVLDMMRAHALGFRPSVSLIEGIRETMEWYRANRDVKISYNHFSATR